MSIIAWEGNEGNNFGIDHVILLGRQLSVGRKEIANKFFEKLHLFAPGVTEDVTVYVYDRNQKTADNQCGTDDMFFSKYRFPAGGSFLGAVFSSDGDFSAAILLSSSSPGFVQY